MLYSYCCHYPLQRYKGIWNCLAILTRALGGNYVNFGVFELYGDPALKVCALVCAEWYCFVGGCRVCGAWVPLRVLPTHPLASHRLLPPARPPLQDALDMSLKLALSVPLPDILAYRKLAKAYYALLDVLCHNHANVVATRDTGAHRAGAGRGGGRVAAACLSPLLQIMRAAVRGPHTSSDRQTPLLIYCIFTSPWRRSHLCIFADQPGRGAQVAGRQHQLAGTPCHALPCNAHVPLGVVPFLRSALRPGMYASR